MEATIIAPVHAPRDARDVAAAAAVSVAFLLVLVTLLVPLTRLLPELRSLWFVLLLLPFLIRRFLVRRLELTPRGIRFVRAAGPPTFVRWDDITGIRPATAREVLLNDWLWPFRLQAFTATLSGHYRIDWGQHSCYYPPVEEGTFVETCRKHVMAPVRCPWDPIAPAAA